MNLHYLAERDLPALIDILNDFNLITQDIDINSQIYMGIEIEGRYAAVGGLEFHFPYALIRSMAVCRRHQGKGHARLIYHALQEHAFYHHISELYLLTETAEKFFTKLGFESVKRPTVPDVIKTTSQFSSLCTDDAVVMKKRITPSV